MPDDGTLSEDEIRELTDAAVALLLRSADEDVDECARIVTTVGEKYGHDGVFRLCCAMANATGIIMGVGRDKGTDPDHGMVSLLVVRGGKLINSQDVDPRLQPDVWAYQFVATYVNDGPGNAWPLFVANLNDQTRTVDNISALIRMAGRWARWKERRAAKVQKE